MGQARGIGSKRVENEAGVTVPGSGVKKLHEKRGRDVELATRRKKKNMR